MTLSNETKRRIADLANKQDNYQPNQETKNQLSDKTLIMIVGATCMGKSTLMNEVEHRSHGVKIVGTTTTRPRRPDDHPARYTYFEHTDSGLEPLLNSIEQGGVVQYVVNPHSGFIYASHVEDYKSNVNIGDYFASVIDDFKQYGFDEIMPITIVSNPDDWERRLAERFSRRHPDRQARLEEAIESLDWSLHQEDMQFAVNIDGDPVTGAETILSIIQGGNGASNGRELAEACLERARSLL